MKLRVRAKELKKARKRSEENYKKRMREAADQQSKKR
jgi:hypothetical protein